MSSRRLEGYHYPISQFISDIWLSTSGFHLRLIFWYSLRLVSQLLGLVQPIILAKIIDSLATRSQSFSQILSLVIVNAVIQAARMLINNRSKYRVNYLADRIRLVVRQKSISKLISFDLGWHESHSSGKKVSIISKGADSLRNLIRFVSGGGGGIDMIVNIGAVLLIFASLQPKYFVVGITNTIAYLGVFFYINSRLNRKIHLLNKDNERVIGKNFDYFSNMHLIKSLGIGDQINRVLFRKELSYTNRAIKVVKSQFNKWIYVNTIATFFNALAITLIVFDIYSGRITIGSFFILSGYIGRLQDGLGDVADNTDNIIEFKLGFLRMIQLLKSGTVQTNSGRLSFPTSLKTISFHQIKFTYPKSKLPILNDVTFQIQAGTKVGLVGESGSGKTTITKLLLRLYLLGSGKIKFNQQSINQLDPNELRRNIAVVPQESEIFNLTFKENIAIASENHKFNPNLYQLAISISHCDPILKKIKNNHQAMLGEKGIKLSGGEKQRLGIARAVYKNSPIMVFDESTSSLDSKTEEIILSNLEKHFSDKTIFWVAHRLSTLRFTERIIVFDHGKIVEDGSFDELIRLQGHFYQLWQIQKKTKLS